MDDKTCATCRWWEHSEPARVAGLCHLFTTGGGATRAALSPVIVEAQRHTKARIDGDYGYDADFLTDPEFGCVHWEAD